MSMSYKNVFALNVIVFASIALTLERLARLVYPEFKNHIHSIVTNNDMPRIILRIQDVSD